MSSTIIRFIINNENTRILKNLRVKISKDSENHNWEQVNDYITNKLSTLSAIVMIRYYRYLLQPDENNKKMKMNNIKMLYFNILHLKTGLFST